MQRAVYSRFNNHPELRGNCGLYSDALLLARHAVEAILEATRAAAPPPEGLGRHIVTG